MIRPILDIAIKTAALAALAFLFPAAGFGQGGKETFVPDRQAQILMLTSGSQSEVSEPFVFVARSPAALDELSKLVSLPDVAFGADFKKTAIVAAFAGSKPTGGYSVDIESKDGKVIVTEKAPPADSVVTEALTTPFAVAAVPVEEEDSLQVEIPDLWKESAERYPILSGFFSVSGGFVARDQTFSVTGAIGVMRHGDLVTFIANVSSSDMRRELKETVSAVGSDPVFLADRMEAGDFLERPHPPLKIRATFEGNWLKMVFEPGKRDYVVNDGFVAKGEIAAKRKPPVVDTPAMRERLVPEEPPARVEEDPPVVEEHPPVSEENPPADEEQKPPLFQEGNT